MKILVPAPHPERVYPSDDEARDLASPLVWVVDEFLSGAECVAMVERFESIGFAPAPINVGGGFERRPDVRNNDRVVFDDAELAARLFARLEPHVPSTMYSDPLVVAGLNERFRGYRYDPGQEFRDHYDGSFRRNERESSQLTFMIYLNDGFEGGSTRFVDFDLDVDAVRGRALLFQHAQRHAGRPVRAGRKYVLRSDVMYRKASS